MNVAKLVRVNVAAALKLVKMVAKPFTDAIRDELGGMKVNHPAPVSVPEVVAPTPAPSVVAPVALPVIPNPIPLPVLPVVLVAKPEAPETVRKAKKTPAPKVMASAAQTKTPKATKPVRWTVGKSDNPEMPWKATNKRGERLFKSRELARTFARGMNGE